MMLRLLMLLMSTPAHKHCSNRTTWTLYAFPDGIDASPGVYSCLPPERLNIADTKLLAFLVESILKSGAFSGGCAFPGSACLAPDIIGLPGLAGKASSALVGDVNSRAGTSMPDGGRKLVSDCPICQNLLRRAVRGRFTLTLSFFLDLDKDFLIPVPLSSAGEASWATPPLRSSSSISPAMVLPLFAMFSSGIEINRRSPRLGLTPVASSICFCISAALRLFVVGSNCDGSAEMVTT
jgi:hypothetical protein